MKQCDEVEELEVEGELCLETGESAPYLFKTAPFLLSLILQMHWNYFTHNQTYH